MKYVASTLIFALVILFGDCLFASEHGDLIWAKTMGGTQKDIGLSVAVDSSRNVYTTGSFEGIVDFDPNAGVYNQSSVAGSDIFISKLDSNGNFVWIKAFGGGALSDYGFIITTDYLGNVYTTGRFKGIVDFDPGVNAFYLTSTGSSYNNYICKLDSNGNFIWAMAQELYLIDMFVDNVGNVYTTGDFKGTVDFDPGSGVHNLTSVSNLTIGGGDVFISKLDSSGNFIWVKSLGGISAWGTGRDIVVDSTGNVYTSGEFGGGNLSNVGIMDFDPGDGVFELGGNLDASTFISKLDSKGNFVWAKPLHLGHAIRYPNKLSVDFAGNVYITGSFTGSTVDFDPSTDFFEIHGNEGDIFVSKFDKNGKFVWVKTMRGGGASTAVRAISTDTFSNIYTIGSFQGSVDFDPAVDLFNLTSAGGDDIFISKLDSNGKFVWAVRIGGHYEDQGRGISIDDLGNVYSTGSFIGTADFSISKEGDELTSNGGKDIYVTKFYFEESGPFRLSVSSNSFGEVTSSPSGINCPTDCTELYEKNMSVTLKAVPAKGAVFGSWSEASCKGIGTCTVIMDRDRQIGANFGRKGGVPCLLMLLKKKK